MGKKRKGLWVGGAIVVAVALFAAVAFLIGYNSTEARMERAVAQIVEEYGFELDQAPDGPGVQETMPFSVTEFLRAPMRAETAGEVVDFIRGACPSLDYEDGSGGDPLMGLHRFVAKEPDGSLIAEILFSPDDKGLVGLGPVDRQPSASIDLIMFDRPGLWQSIKGLWPW